MASPWERDWGDSGGAAAAQSPWEKDWNNPTGEARAATADTPRPSIIPGGNKEAAGLWATMRASLAPKVEDQIAHYSAVMGIPKERFGVLNGDIVYADQQGQYQRVVPGVFSGPWQETPERLARWITSQFGPSIPGAAGAVAGTITAPTGAASIPAAAGAAGAADVARQSVSNYLLDKDIVKNIDWGNAAGQALLAGGAQGVGLMAAKGLQNNPLGVSPSDRVKAADPKLIAESQRIAAEAKSRGVDLSAGQATGLTSLQQQERQALRWPETADTIADFRNAQRNTQIPAAVRSEIANISPAGPEDAIGKFREGATATVKHVENLRASKAKPLYDEAFKANPSVASNEIDRILETPAGKQALRNAAETMQNLRTRMGLPDKELAEHVKELVDRGEMVKPKGGVAAGLKLRSLDLVKQELDDMAGTAAQRGEKLNASAYRQLARDLRGELDRLDATAIAGPNSTKAAGGLYAQARKIYSTESDLVDAVKDGGVGAIERLKGMDTSTIVRRAFSSGMNPADIRKMRMNFEAAGRGADFDAGIAAFLSDKLDDAMRVNADGQRGNVAGKFFANVWGDERQKRVVQAALTPKQMQGFESLMEVLHAASRSLPEGSPTATDLGRMGTGGLSTTGKIVGKVFSPGKWPGLGDEVAEGVAALREPAKREALAKALLSGQFDRELSRMRMVSPGSKQAAALTAQILTGAGVIAARPSPRDFPAADVAPLQ